MKQEIFTPEEIVLLTDNNGGNRAIYVRKGRGNYHWVKMNKVFQVHNDNIHKYRGEIEMTDKPELTREDKIAKLIRYDNEHMHMGKKISMLRHGFLGYNNMADTQIDELYKNLPC